jgi:DNA-binding transcriptional MerR regulator
MSAYTIRELENLSGIKAHTIRIWEKRYGLIAPQRTSTNIRTYCDTELKKLLNISILNRNGLKISKIAQLTTEEIVARINQFTTDVSSTESHLESLTLAMIDMDEFRFEQVLSRAVIQFGFEETVTRVLYPFFARIGLMWQTGSIIPAQEHFISNLVKQKFYAAIDSLIGNEMENARRFIFFLPEGELHEIGLLFATYLARKRGFRTVYLGQSLPLEDLTKVAQLPHSDFLFTTLVSSFHAKDLPKYILQLSRTFPDKTIFVSGSQQAGIPHDPPDNVTFLASPEAFIAALDGIQSKPAARN